MTLCWPVITCRLNTRKPIGLEQWLYHNRYITIGIGIHITVNHRKSIVNNREGHRVLHVGHIVRYVECGKQKRRTYFPVGMRR